VSYTVIDKQALRTRYAELKASQGMTQAAIAEVIGVTAQTVSRMFGDDYASEHYPRLFEILGLPVDVTSRTAAKTNRRTTMMSKQLTLSVDDEARLLLMLGYAVGAASKAGEVEMTKDFMRFISRVLDQLRP
jgi:transcriptional regulator with XRE-family HTH domain